MLYHIVLGRHVDLASMTEGISRGLRTRHALQQLADRLRATVPNPTEHAIGPFDTVRSKLVGTPIIWAFARDFVKKMTAQDVIFCSDEAVGLPMAAMCARTSDRPKIAVLVHNVDRPRTRLAFKVSRKLRSADLYLAVSERQLDFLRGPVGVDADRTRFINDQTDLSFFRPGPQSIGKRRPMLVSTGLEKRDYRILAAAAGDLDVDVHASSFSADATPGRSTFPDFWPENFVRRRYELPELAQLYRDADAIVASLIPNIYTACITTMVQGMASGRPVIITRTEGLRGYLDDGNALTVV